MPPVYHEPVPEIKVVEQKIDPVRIVTIRIKDSVVAQVAYSDYWKFKDSVSKNTKDTLFVLSGDQVLIKPFNPENYFRPSIYVVTNKDGFITIKLPEAMHKNYKLVFLSMENEKLFTSVKPEEVQVKLKTLNADSRAITQIASRDQK